MYAFRWQYGEEECDESTTSRKNRALREELFHDVSLYLSFLDDSMISVSRNKI